MPNGVATVEWRSATISLGVMGVGQVGGGERWKDSGKRTRRRQTKDGEDTPTVSDRAIKLSHCGSGVGTGSVSRATDWEQNTTTVSGTRKEKGKEKGTWKGGGYRKRR